MKHRLTTLILLCISTQVHGEIQPLSDAAAAALAAPQEQAKDRHAAEPKSAEVAFARMQTMSAHYVEHAETMKIACENRKNPAAAGKAYLEKNPPKANRDVNINFSPTDKNAANFTR